MSQQYSEAQFSEHPETPAQVNGELRHVRVRLADASGQSTFHEARTVSAASPEAESPMRTHDLVQEVGAEEFAKSNPSWLAVASSLLAEAEKMQRDCAIRRSYLTGAVLSAYFSETAEETAAFVEAVYKAGLHEKVAIACDQSPLEINSRSGKHPNGAVKDWARIFRLDPEHIQVYLDHQKGIKPSLDGQPSPKKIKSFFLQEVRSGALPDTSLQLQGVKASVGDENVGGPILDMRKAERFALQQDYIEHQVKAVLGEDVKNAPLAAYLRSMRDRPQQRRTDALAPHRTPTNADIRKLVEDTVIAFRELSVKTTEQFSLWGKELHPEAMTPEQLAALRYREIAAELETYEVLARYIDNDKYLAQNSQPGIETSAAPSNSEIFSVSEPGAAIPDVAERVLVAAREVMRQSPRYPLITPEGVRDALQRKRSQVIRMALTGMAEFSETTFESKSGEVTIDHKNKLDLKLGLRIPAKGALGQAAATILDCPAAHVSHPDRGKFTAAEKAQFGSTNFIDHVMAILITEAYERGIFAW